MGACTPVVSLHTCIWSPHPNVSLPPGAVYLFRILSFAAELFLFIYAGVTMWSVTLWKDSEEFTKARGVLPLIGGPLCLVAGCQGA